MSVKSISTLVKILSRTFPKTQAEREATWITRELSEDLWIDACEKRAQQYPLQYILKTQPFGNLELLCRPKVLIPRLDTEDWVLEAIELLNRNKVMLDNILDYCTGSGCIGLSFASQITGNTSVDCVDYSPEAVKLAADNLARNKAEIKAQCSISKGNIFDAFIPRENDYKSAKNISFLVSNPPYIPAKDLVEGEVELSVLKYEPRDALLGNLEFYEALCENILLKYTTFEGFIFELGYIEQAEKVSQILKKEGWIVGIRNDHGNHIRNVLGWKQNSKLNILSTMVHGYL